MSMSICMRIYTSDQTEVSNFPLDLGTNSRRICLGVVIRELVYLWIGSTSLAVSDISGIHGGLSWFIC